MNAESREKLKQAFLMDITEEFSNISDTLPFKPSKAFDKKMEKLIKQSRKPYYKFTATGFRRAVCVIAAIMVLMVSSLSVGAVRDAIKEFFITHFSNHATVEYNKEFVNTETTTNSVSETEYEITYIPEGFELNIDDKTKSRIDKIYFKDEYYIGYSQTLKEDYSVNFDNEQSSFTYETYDGIEYLVHTLGSDYTFVWDNGKYVFEIHANIDKNEIINIVKSVKKVKK